MNLALHFSTAVAACVLLNSCGLFDRDSRPAPVGLQQSQRYDPISRTWVALDTPTVRTAFVPPENLAPEKASDTAKVLPSLSSAPPSQPGTPATGAPEADAPGFLQRMGRVATSPLRAVGIGDGQ